ncbi:Uncharacterised protein [Candidatus Venteria ishoeyi]|nr:Uncharacterised protein [Candidatus Venteria ishoeyi]
MPFYHPGIEEGLQTTLYQLYARMRDRNDKKPPELHVI